MWRFVYCLGTYLTCYGTVNLDGIHKGHCSLAHPPHVRKKPQDHQFFFPTLVYLNQLRVAGTFIHSITDKYPSCPVPCKTLVMTSPAFLVTVSQQCSGRSFPPTFIIIMSKVVDLVCGGLATMSSMMSSLLSSAMAWARISRILVASVSLWLWRHLRIK